MTACGVRRRLIFSKSFSLVSSSISHSFRISGFLQQTSEQLLHWSIIKIQAYCIHHSLNDAGIGYLINIFKHQKHPPYMFEYFSRKQPIFIINGGDFWIMRHSVVNMSIFSTIKLTLWYSIKSFLAINCLGHSQFPECKNVKPWKYSHDTY